MASGVPLTDDQLVLIALAPATLRAADLARLLNLPYAGVRRALTRMRAEGWASPLRWTTCLVCGQPVASNPTRAPREMHPTCAVERDREMHRLREQRRRRDHPATAAEDSRRAARRRRDHLGRPQRAGRLPRTPAREDDWLLLTDAAAMLNVQPEDLYRYIDAGRLRVRHARAEESASGWGWRVRPRTFVLRADVARIHDERTQGRRYDPPLHSRTARAYMTAEEAAIALSLTVSTVLQSAARWRLPSRTVGGRRMFSRRAIADLAARRSDATLITAAEAARRLGVSRERVRQWIAAGRLPARTVQTHVYLAVDDVDRFQREREERAAP